MRIKVVLTSLLLSFLVFTTVSGQQISGSVIDKDSSEALLGATVAFLAQSDSTLIKGTKTDFSGGFQIEVPTEEPAFLMVSFIGYTPQFFNPPFKSNLTVTLSQDVNVLDEVKIKLRKFAARISGDTIEYSAANYKTNQYANAEDLVRKMPGITKSNGSIQANGEEVKKVTVDGKPFMGNDPNAALKNLPSQMVNKVQVHDQKSEQARLTGVDDGETEKALNITTKDEYKKAVFGKGFVSYGPFSVSDWSLPGYYHSLAGLHFFNNEQRISVLLMANNINIQNFSKQDLSTATGGGETNRFLRRRRIRGSGFNNGGEIEDFLTSSNGGISETRSIGINFSDYWGKKWDVNMSYFTNNSFNDQETDIDRIYFLGDTSNQFYDQRFKQETYNTLHRYNGRFNYRINDKMELLLLPNFSAQQSRQSVDNTSKMLTEAGDTINFSDNRINSDGQGFSFSNNALFKVKGKKKYSNLVASLSTSIEDQSSNSDQVSAIKFFGTDTIDAWAIFSKNKKT